MTFSVEQLIKLYFLGLWCDSFIIWTNIWVYCKCLSCTESQLIFFFLNAGELFNSSVTRVTFPSFILQNLTSCVIISSCPDVSILEIFKQHQYWLFFLQGNEILHLLSSLDLQVTVLGKIHIAIYVLFFLTNSVVSFCLWRRHMMTWKRSSHAAHKTYFPFLLAPVEKCAPWNTQEYLLTLPLLHGLSELSPFTKKNTFVLKDFVYVETFTISIFVIFQA